MEMYQALDWVMSILLYVDQQAAKHRQNYLFCLLLVFSKYCYFINNPMV